MTNLIEINRNEQGEQLVSARELHAKLQISERFNSWFERMLRYGFVENVDFTSVKSFTVVNNGAKKVIDEYILKLDMAKQICMLQRNEIGTQIRLYFIECEKQLNELTNKKLLLADLFSDDKMVVVHAHKALIELEKKPLLEKIEQDKPMVGFASQISEAEDSILVREFGKVLSKKGIKMGEKTLYEWLRKNAYIFVNSNEPTQKAVNAGLLELIEYSYKTRYGNRLATVTKVTGKGQVILANKIMKELQEGNIDNRIS